MREWTKKIDLSEKDFVIVPINDPELYAASQPGPISQPTLTDTYYMAEPPGRWTPELEAPAGKHKKVTKQKRPYYTVAWLLRVATRRQITEGQTRLIHG